MNIVTSRQRKAWPPKVSPVAIALVAAALPLGCASTAFGASLSRSVVVPGSPASIWAMIGPYCAIQSWLPPVGTCVEDGKSPPTRTLVTKDGSATFIERQTRRNDAKHTYSYTFVSSPLPVSDYTSTISVTSNTARYSTVTWRSFYTPAAGKDQEAKQALAGIYKAGLESIKAQATQRSARVAASGSDR